MSSNKSPEGKSALRHAQEPSNSQKTAKVEDGDNQDGTDSESQHHAWQDEIWPVYLSKNAEERGSQDVRNEEAAEGRVGLVFMEVKCIY